VPAQKNAAGSNRTQVVRPQVPHSTVVPSQVSGFNEPLVVSASLLGWTCINAE
jgi:hypothetical protein